jgi:hypothetical protein
MGKGTAMSDQTETPVVLAVAAFNFAAYYDEIVSRLKSRPGPVRIMEVGVGESTIHLVTAIRDAGLKVEFHCCDPFASTKPGESTLPAFQAELARLGLTDLVAIRAGHPQNLLPGFAPYYFDFIFLNGSPQFSEISKELEHGIYRLKPDGILAGHNLEAPDVQLSIARFGLSYADKGNGVWELTTKIGIVYVAWGEHPLNETARAAWWGRLPTCLITDLTTVVPDNVFGQVIRRDFSEYAGLHHFYRKMDAVRLTPFDVTMYSDGDTFPIGDLSLGFQKAVKNEFAIVIAPGQTFHRANQEYVHYNCGVLFFRGKPLTWADAILAKAKDFPDNDEVAWALTFEQMGITPAVLPSVFNLVAAGKIHDRAIRCFHSRHEMQTHLVSEFDEIFSRTKKP